MDTLLDEIWPLIIGGDWRVYAGLLAVPRFARLVLKSPVVWRRMLTVCVEQPVSAKWLLAGRFHRDDDLPAIILPGAQKWYRFGKLHRANDLPAAIFRGGRQEWWLNGVKQANR